MNHPRRLFIILAALCAALWATAAGTAAARPPSPSAAPEAIATAYLEARAAAVTAADPGAPLALLVAPGSRLAAREKLIARGHGLNAVKLGHFVDSVRADVTVDGVSVAPDGTTATVSAHVITTVDWHSSENLGDVEASGVDHVVSLALGPRGWRVTADQYEDVLVPAYLEDAGATPAVALRVARDIERGSAGRIRARIRTPGRIRTADRIRTSDRIREAAPGGRSYVDTIVYRRDTAVAYADKYCLTYFRNAVRFSADCANFASQCAFAGRMPMNPGSWKSGWWYDSHGTGAPSDDTYSWSWINVGKQMPFWNGLRTDWVGGITDLGRGDFVYYDWSGDGVWDHVAVVVGTNSAGQKVIDAHTTDHYRVYWKLGASGCKYKFARVRPQWMV